MQINLNQREIESALKEYITGQGINLTNRKVDIDFTAGRNESGLSAKMDIGCIGVDLARGESMTTVFEVPYGNPQKPPEAKEQDVKEKEPGEVTKDTYEEAEKSPVSLFG